MRTNIDLDEYIVKEAFKFVNVRTKKELVKIALEEFVENHKRKDLRELRGNIQFKKNYNYKNLREGSVK